MSGHFDYAGLKSAIRFALASIYFNENLHSNISVREMVVTYDGACLVRPAALQARPQPPNVLLNLCAKA